MSDEANGRICEDSHPLKTCELEPASDWEFRSRAAPSLPGRGTETSIAKSFLVSGFPNGKVHPKQKFERGEKYKEEISRRCYKEPSSSSVLT